VADVGRDAVVDAQSACHAGQFERAVERLAPFFNLTPAERQAWIVMLPVLQQDENRPTWQKAGVRR
jgi:hypothetical protein